MVIDGVSQSSGVERVVDVEPADGGVSLTVRDRGGAAERGRAVAPADGLMTVLVDRPAGPQQVSEAITLEVRRNEVLLVIGGADAAVGLDDLSDAVAAALPPG